MTLSLPHPYKNTFQSPGREKSSGPEIKLRIPVLVAGKKF
jgi:hypothetical protein